MAFHQVLTHMAFYLDSRALWKKYMKIFIFTLFISSTDLIKIKIKQLTMILSDCWFFSSRCRTSGSVTMISCWFGGIIYEKCEKLLMNTNGYSTFKSYYELNFLDTTSFVFITGRMKKLCKIFRINSFITAKTSVGNGRS